MNQRWLIRYVFSDNMDRGVKRLGVESRGKVRQGRKLRNDNDDGGKRRSQEEVMDQPAGSSRGITTGVETRGRRLGGGKPVVGGDPFGSALLGRSNRNVKDLNLEVKNLGNQIKSLRSNLWSEIEFKGQLARNLKKKESRIVDLAREVDGYQGQVKRLEKLRSEALQEVKSVRIKVENHEENLLRELREKEARLKELERRSEVQEKDLGFALGEVSRMKKMEAVRVRGQLEAQIEETTKQEALVKTRRKKLMSLIGDGILVTLRRKAALN